jgi:hypothetical protein
MIEERNREVVRGGSENIVGSTVMLGTIHLVERK